MAGDGAASTEEGFAKAAEVFSMYSSLGATLAPLLKTAVQRLEEDQDHPDPVYALSISCVHLY